MDMATIYTALIGAAGGAGLMVYRHYRTCRKAGMSRPDALKVALTIKPGGGGGPGPLDP